MSEGQKIEEIWMRAIPAEKTLTFNNDGIGQLSLFTITGSVKVKLIAIVKTNVASAAAGTVSVGIATNVDAIIAVTLATDLDAKEIWHDTSPDSEIESLDTIRGYLITDGNDITLDILVGQIDSGVILFKIEWSPIEEGSILVVVP
ncbi:hypothetical protein LCGC14_1993040 [marine sediment metagenome]|uniref:Uncharacterized protein n=1 Tax=marine sediment metagenome TaxID=412755 RepID=A0A0F9F5P0_9ZZZZ